MWESKSRSRLHTLSSSLLVPSSRPRSSAARRSRPRRAWALRPCRVWARKAADSSGGSACEGRQRRASLPKRARSQSGRPTWAVSLKLHACGMASRSVFTWAESPARQRRRLARPISNHHQWRYCSGRAVPDRASPAYLRTSRAHCRMPDGAQRWVERGNRSR